MSDIAQSENTPLDLYEFPSLFTRAKALAIDALIMLAVFVSASYIIDLIGGAPDWVRAAILITMLYLYEPILVTSFGATFGHYIMGIRVKRLGQPKRNINIFAAFIRVSLKIALGWLSFISVTVANNKRTLHDMGSGSIVVDYNQGE